MILLSVVKAFHQAHGELSYSSDPKLSSAGYEFIPADVHVPVLDIQDLPVLPQERILSDAVIQGYFDSSRRDYERIFNQLSQDIHGKHSPDEVIYSLTFPTHS